MFVGVCIQRPEVEVEAIFKKGKQMDEYQL